MATTRSDISNALPWLIGGVIAYKGLELLEEPKPGGDVDPNEGDTRAATMDEVTAAVYAEGIYTAVWGGGLFADPTEDEEAVIAIMEQCLVTNDVRLLLNAYGSRGPITDQMDLTATIMEYLAPSDRDEINADYGAKGITIHF